uniref:Uncharacterized protein n=1 Tax=Steinernema glaseri TaxID=37863 RepID=A0A1I7YSJ9_9BILA
MLDSNNEEHKTLHGMFESKIFGVEEQLSKQGVGMTEGTREGGGEEARRRHVRSSGSRRCATFPGPCSWGRVLLDPFVDSSLSRSRSNGFRLQIEVEGDVRLRSLTDAYDITGFDVDLARGLPLVRVDGHLFVR